MGLELRVGLKRLLRTFVPPCPLAIVHSKGGDKILFYQGNNVIWYNIENMATKTEKIFCSTLGVARFNFTVCQDSLVSPGPYSEIDEDAEEVIVDEDENSD